MGLILLFWILGLSNLKTLRFKLKFSLRKNRMLFYSLSTFFIIGWISVFNSTNISFSVKNILESSLFGIFILLVIISIPLNKKHYNIVFNVILISSICLIVISFLEIYLGRNVFEPLLKQFGTLTEYQETVLNEKTRGGVRRIIASFNNPLIYAHILVLIIPTLLHTKNNISNNYGKKAIINITIITLIILGTFTKSRTFLFLISLLIVYYIYYYSSYLKPKVRYLIYSISLVSLSLLTTILSVEYLERYLGVDNILMDENRSNQLEMAANLLPELPLFGFGPGIGAQVLGYGAIVGAPTIDNYFITITLDSGLLALISYLTFLSITIKKYLFDDSDLKIIKFGMLLFILFLITLSVNQAHTIFYFILGLIISKNDQKSQFRKA